MACSWHCLEIFLSPTQIAASLWPRPFILVGKIIKIPAVITMCHEQSLRPEYCRSPPQPDSGRPFVEGAVMGGVTVTVVKYMCPEAWWRACSVDSTPGNGVFPFSLQKGWYVLLFVKGCELFGHFF